MIGKGVGPLFLVLALIASSARAETPAPWKQGVSKPDQAKATKIFESGNKAFEAREYAQAVQQYTAALAIWDHPQIHFNMAVALISLDRYLEASEHIAGALRFDGGGLEKDKADEARTYQKLLASRIATLSIVAQQPGVHVTVDGREITLVGGTATITTVPGAHALAATRDGFEPITRDLVLAGGQTTSETLELAPRARRMRIERRFRPWVPWTVVGVGAGATLVGVTLFALGSSNMSEFQRELGTRYPDGAPFDQLPDSLKSLRTRARIENAAGITLMIGGGAAVLTGIAMVALNQAREVEVPPVSVQASPTSVQVTWAAQF